VLTDHEKRRTTMRAAMRSTLLTVGSLALALVLTGCAGRSWQFWKTSEAPAEPTVATAAPAPGSPSVPTARPASAAEMAAAPASSTGFAELPALADVRFRSGLATLGKADVKALDGVVRWLKDNPGSLVRIEGHSDDLGTPVENAAVGQKRAASVMQYLVSKGLNSERIAIVSYGSDRPVCAERTDGCRAKNRRAHFLVKQP
jgi:outer membrane protein OmpA-like peptidoglycan-associated protein